MKGVEFVVDDSGKKKAVVIDLEQWGDLWEDSYDVLVSESRENEPTVPWSELKAEMKKGFRKVAEYNVEFIASAAKEFRSLTADIKHGRIDH